MAPNLRGFLFFEENSIKRSDTIILFGCTDKALFVRSTQQTKKGNRGYLPTHCKTL